MSENQYVVSTWPYPITIDEYAHVTLGSQKWKYVFFEKKTKNYIFFKFKKQVNKLYKYGYDYYVIIVTMTDNIL